MVSEKQNKEKYLFGAFLFFVLCFIWALVISKPYSKVSNSEDPSSEVETKNTDGDFSVEVVGSDESLLQEELEEEKVAEDMSTLEINDDEMTGSEEKDESTDPATETQKTSIFGTPKQTKGGVLRIGLVTDTHVASEWFSNGWKLKDIFSERIRYLTQDMNDNFGPDFIVINGDVIEGTKVPMERGMEELRLTKALFDRTIIPKYWVLGNHDVRSVKKKQWKEALGIDYTHKSIVIKGYKIIILDSNFLPDGSDVVPGKQFTRGRVGPSEIKWLTKELASSEKKIVFMHHPPLRNISSKINEGLLKNANELQALFSEGNVMAVFAGHIEDLYSKEINGVHYFVFPGMTKSPEYLGNYVNIEIKKNKIRAEMSFQKENGEYETVEIDEN